MTDRQIRDWCTLCRTVTVQTIPSFPARAQVCTCCGTVSTFSRRTS